MIETKTLVTKFVPRREESPDLLRVCLESKMNLKRKKKGEVEINWIKEKVMNLNKFYMKFCKNLYII